MSSMPNAKVFNEKRTNRNIQRKFYTQMDKLELDYLKEKINQVDEVTLTDHCKQRMKEIDITTEHLYKILGHVKAYNIIEYNEGKRPGDTRIVIKDFNPIKCKDGRFVNAYYCIDYTTKQLITIWVNLLGDTHDTLDMSIYNKDLKIL